MAERERVQSRREFLRNALAGAAAAALPSAVKAASFPKASRDAARRRFAAAEDYMAEMLSRGRPALAAKAKKKFMSAVGGGGRRYWSSPAVVGLLNYASVESKHLDFTAGEACEAAENCRRIADALKKGGHETEGRKAAALLKHFRLIQAFKLKAARLGGAAYTLLMSELESPAGSREDYEVKALAARILRDSHRDLSYYSLGRHPFVRDSLHNQPIKLPPEGFFENKFTEFRDKSKKTR